MKLKYKSGLIFTIFGFVTLIIMAISYDFIIEKIVIKNQNNSTSAIADEVALHMQSHLIEEIKISTTITSAPIIQDFLIKSNKDFNILTGGVREIKISQLNEKWKNSKDINDLFVQQYLTNEIALYLKKQQLLFPGAYGEIFLTNKYGVMIATTGKLTTLAHSMKYWWKACYNDGNGRVFLDDRGFDASSNGVVLGIVIPIRYNNEIIGILKSNINIMGPLTDIIREFSERNKGSIKLVRTNGAILSALNEISLSTNVSEDITKNLSSRKKGVYNNTENNQEFLVAFSPLNITLGSDDAGFGGSKKSIDHIKGNRGEAWHIVITQNRELALEGAHIVVNMIISFGIIFIMIMILVVFFLSKMITKPINDLLVATTKIGEGCLDTKVFIKSNDEIGSLGNAINKMSQNIKDTMTSKDQLLELNSKLQEALDNVNTLSGLLPICSGCKKIRDDNGYWNQLESYISDHTEAVFSHSLCIDCADELYGDENWYKKK